MLTGEYASQPFRVVGKPPIGQNIANVIVAYHNSIGLQSSNLLASVVLVFKYRVVRRETPDTVRSNTKFGMPSPDPLGSWVLDTGKVRFVNWRITNGLLLVVLYVMVVTSGLRQKTSLTMRKIWNF